MDGRLPLSRLGCSAAQRYRKTRYARTPHYAQVFGSAEEVISRVLPLGHAPALSVNDLGLAVGLEYWVIVRSMVLFVQST